jgi:hypothetical protein
MSNERAKRLADFLKQHERTPFAWGSFDCVLFAARCADYVTGNDYASEFIGTYHTALQAQRVITDKLAATFETVFDSYYARVPHQLAQPGDIVLAVPPTLKPTYGIGNGHQVVMPGPDGLVGHSLSEVYTQQAWRVR